MMKKVCNPASAQSPAYAGVRLETAWCVPNSANNVASYNTKTQIFRMLFTILHVETRKSTCFETRLQQTLLQKVIEKWAGT